MDRLYITRECETQRIGVSRGKHGDKKMQLVRSHEENIHNEDIVFASFVEDETTG